jgi:hypothetical protein
MRFHSVKVAFAALNAAGTFRKLAANYKASAIEYPRYANVDLAEADRMKDTARWHIRLAATSDAPRLP